MDGRDVAQLNVTYFLSINFIPMKKTLIIILVIIVLVAGWILYLYRDGVKDAFDKTTENVLEEAGEVQDEIVEEAEEVQDEIVEGIEEVQEEIAN